MTAIIAPQTIVSVDTSTNELEITAHGLNTGDTFLGVYTDGGTLPSPLSGTADYWAIKTDNDHIKLATSSSNAFAGTAVDITTTGSGTLQLVRGLPYRRPRVAVPGSQVFSLDCNQTWESLQALHQVLTAQAQTVFSNVRLAVPIASDLTIEGSATVETDATIEGELTVQGELYRETQWTQRIPAAKAMPVYTDASELRFDGGKTFVSSGSGSSALLVPIDVTTGDRILGFIVFILRAGTGANITATLERVSTSGVATNLGDGTIPGSSAGVKTITVGGLAVDVGSDSDATYQIRIDFAAGNGGEAFVSAQVDCTRPAS